MEINKKQILASFLVTVHIPEWARIMNLAKEILKAFNYKKNASNGLLEDDIRSDRVTISSESSKDGRFSST